MLKRTTGISRRWSHLLMLSAVGVWAAAAASAQVTVVPPKPQVGSSNPASPEPPVTRPSTKPCAVTLLHEQAFADFSQAPLTYAPPANCPGPWAKVVLTADFTVSAGVQYDRTAYFYLGGANIFYGTTAEPSSNLSPSWHVERDLTDYSALFQKAQTGGAFAGNIVNSTYTGVIYANAALEFYPASLKDPAPTVPDVLVPVSTNNSPYTLNTTADQATASFTLPRNVEKVYLDVIAQSQINDEFWYFCVPNDVAGELESCGNTAFRETEITIDGKPAGVAPVYPWIYTGGIDPYLWRPIVGVQTLNFKPYRVDLSPFAGVLADGSSHTIAISVYNADSYFLATANLLAYRDKGRQEVTGGLLTDTLSLAPAPQINENLSTGDDGSITGTVAVGSKRAFTISGYIDTSHGRVETTLDETVNFLSTQTFDVTATQDEQNAVQTSTVDATTTIKTGLLVETDTKHSSYPLTVDYNYVVNPDGTAAQTAKVQQNYDVSSSQALNGFALVSDEIQEQVNSADTLNFTATGYSGDDTASATYVQKSSQGDCYSSSLAAKDQKLTSATESKSCKIH